MQPVGGGGTGSHLLSIVAPAHTRVFLPELDRKAARRLTSCCLRRLLTASSFFEMATFTLAKQKKKQLGLILYIWNNTAHCSC